MNNRFKPVLIVVGVVVIGAIGLGLYTAAHRSTMPMSSTAPNSQSTDVSNATKTDTVTITGYAFSPATITVKKGTKVTWTNQDTVKHTVTSAEGSPVSFTSELFGKGETYSYTFGTAGTYDYFCKPHPYMKGTVVVTE